MKKLYLRLLLVLAGLAVLALPGKAQAVDQLIVKVPFQFAAGGRTFPAGEYRISRVFDHQPGALLLRSQENPGDVVVLFGEVESISHAQAKLAFEVVGDQHFLSRIESLDYSHVFPLPKADVMMAAAPRMASPSVSSGSN